MRVKELFEKLKGYEDYEINISFDVPNEAGNCGDFDVLEVEFIQKNGRKKIVEKKIILDTDGYRFFNKGCIEKYKIL
jgi:hypothetical protein